MLMGTSSPIDEFEHFSEALNHISLLLSIQLYHFGLNRLIKRTTLILIFKSILRGFLKNRHACFELSHSIELSLRSLSTL